MTYHTYCTWLLVLGGSLLQAVLSTILSLAGALPLAHFVYRYHFLGQRVCMAVAIVWCMMPSRLAALGVQLCYGLTGMWGIVAAHVLLDMPFAFLMLSSAYQGCDRMLYLAARDLGARSWRCYRDVFLPVLAPAVGASAMAIASVSFTSHTIPRIFGTAPYHYTPDSMLEMAYHNQDMFTAFIYLCMRLCVIIPLNSAPISGIRVCDYLSIPRRQSIVWRSKKDCLWVLYAVGVLCLMCGPLIAIGIYGIDQAVVAFWYASLAGVHDVLLGDAVYKVVGASVGIGILSSVLAVGVGLLTCLMYQWVPHNSVRFMCTMSIIIPLLLGGIGCGILFSLLSHYIHESPYLLAILCHAFLNYPTVYRMVRACYARYDYAWVWSAQSLGATPWQAWRTIELPFLMRSLRRAACVIFGFSLTEVGAEGLLAGKVALTMPIAIRLYRQHGIDHAVIGLSLITLMIVWIVAYVVLRSDG